MNVVYELRQRGGLTQALPATSSGVQRSMISRCQNGHTSPTQEMLQRLAQGAGLEVVVLFQAAPTPESIEPAG